jgi:dihydroorotate dehydrogenase
MMDAERSHVLGMKLLQFLDRHPFLTGKAANWTTVKDPKLSQTLLGMTFPNPVGLAAGFDKNAEATRAWGALGFGYVEVGTVTPKAQAGNDLPRLFRIPEQEAIQNAMGFNNHGMRAMRERLKPIVPLHHPLGVNLGKNKFTPNENAVEDYMLLIHELKNVADYFVLNLSSPNTPGLRDLENTSSIYDLFSRAVDATEVPVFLKVSPDPDPSYTVDLCATAVGAGAKGIIATNTSVDYSLSAKSKDFGGLSGKIIREKSYNVFKAIAEELFGKAVLVSVGGIDSGEEAYRRLTAGASLVQVYTGLVYQGPFLIKRINQELSELLKPEWRTSITDVIGSDLKDRSAS